MELSEEERQYVARRAKFARAWPFVGVVLLAFVIGFSAWMFISRPLLANPFFTLARLNGDSVSLSMLTLMAGLLPTVVLMCMALVLIVVLFTFAWFSNEKKYLAMIQKLTAAEGAPEGGLQGQPDAPAGPPQEREAG